MKLHDNGYDLNSDFKSNAQSMNLEGYHLIDPVSMAVLLTHIFPGLLLPVLVIQNPRVCLVYMLISRK